jgi:hypothetical protein
VPGRCSGFPRPHPPVARSGRFRPRSAAAGVLPGKRALCRIPINLIADDRPFVSLQASGSDELRVSRRRPRRDAGSHPHFVRSATLERPKWRVRGYRLRGRPVSTRLVRNVGWAGSLASAGRRAEPACGPGAHPPEPLGDPLTQIARCATARMRARPAARPAQNGTRRPPQRRRAAETVNVNVSCVVGAVLPGSASADCNGYGAAVTSCSRGFAAMAKAPASMRWVAARSTTGPDGVGMVTVMCRCRARWRAGS